MRSHIAWSLPFLALGVAACGGGGSRAAPDPIYQPAELSLDPQTEPVDQDQLAHLMRRTQWGTTPVGRGALVQSGVEGFVSELLISIAEPDIEAAAVRGIAYPDHPTGRELVLWWMELMQRSRAPFRDCMAFYWHDHFATSFVGFSVGSMHFMREQVQTLRRLGTGNLRDLLYEMLTDPAMLVWLNAVDSTKEQPNENLAREFYELFALGVDNGYTAADIRETARAFTGYRLVRDRQTGVDAVLFDITRADTTAKTIFGETGIFGFREVLDLTLAKRPVAEFICRGLFEHFCYAPAPAEVVAQLAALLRAGNYELKPVLRTILRSRAFFAPASRRSHVKSPVEAAIGLLRATGLAFPNAVADFLLTSQGQRLCDPPNVGGWPDDEAWLTAQSMTLRSHLAHAVAMNRDDQLRLGTPFENLLPPPTGRTTLAVVSALAERLGLQLTLEEVVTYQEYLDTRATEAGTELVLAHAPFDGTNPEHISERVRGLLFILTQHPSYLLR